MVLLAKFEKRRVYCLHFFWLEVLTYFGETSGSCLRIYFVFLLFSFFLNLSQQYNKGSINMISYHRKLKELVTFNNKYNIILEFLDESWRVIDSTIEIKIPQEWAGFLCQ